LVHVGRLGEAERLLEHAAAHAAAAGDPLAEAHAHTAAFFARVQLDSRAAADDLRARFGGLRDAFAAAADDVGLSRLWRAQGLVDWLAGRSADAERAWTRGAEHSAAAGDEQGRTDALAWIASALCQGPTPVPVAIARCEEIVDTLGADRPTQALSLRPLANLHAMAGRFDVAWELLAESEAIHADLGVSLHAAVVHDEARIALLAGQPARAEAALRLGCEQLEAMGERALLATTAAMLAQVLLAQEHDEEAWVLTDTAEAAAAPDDLSAELLCGSVRAQLLARRGDIAEAERLIADAVGRAARTDWIVEHADALMARAAVLRVAGQEDVANVTVRQAAELYERKGNVVAARRARSEAGVAA
jgi:ATP/maltotriose-dependent transcriptional regulator MalT